MTIRQSRPRTKLLIDRDPWLRIDQLHASYPFLQRRPRPSGGEFTDSETSDTSRSTTVARGGYSSGANLN